MPLTFLGTVFNRERERVSARHSTMKKTVSVRRGAGRRSVRTSSQSYDLSPLNPIRAKRDRGDDDDDGEDELEIFRRRAEWWRLYHGDPSGIVSGNLRVQAIAHAEKLAAGGLDNPDPGGARPKSGFELIRRRGKGKSIRQKVRADRIRDRGRVLASLPMRSKCEARSVSTGWC